MNKSSGVSGQATVPMNLFATWEIDRSAPNCIPRVCNMTVCKLIVLKELDKEVQSVFIAVKMQGSKRVFRSNEIFLPSNGIGDTTLELTFSLQYPHFVKRDENKLQIMLQRKKRYKNRAMLGYKTLAIGRVDMAHLIQCPVPNGSVLDLLTVKKDDDAAVTIAAHIEFANMSSLPIDADAESDRVSKHGLAERLPDVDNYSEDDEETYSSDPDIGSDVAQELGDDEPRRVKRKNRRKVRMSSSSRQQNFIKTKMAALIRKFKQVTEEEELDPIEQDPEIRSTVPVDYDFLYGELEDLNFSDSGPEVEDNISIVSTPKPKLRPFFDRISHSSSQTEISSMRDHSHPDQNEETADQDKFVSSLPAYDDDSESHRRTSEPVSGAWKPLNSDGQRLKKQASEDDEPNLRFQGVKTGSVQSSPEAKRAHILEGGAQTKGRSASFHTASSRKDSKRTIPTFSKSVSNFLAGLEIEESLPETVFLIDGNDRHGCLLAYTLTLPAVDLSEPVVTHSTADIQSVFAGFLTRLQKFLNRNSLPPSPVKMVLMGSDVYLNCVMRQFVESFSARSSDWQLFIVFFVVPIGSTRLSRYLSSIDTRYCSLFGEGSWKEGIERLSDASSTDRTQDMLAIASKLREYVDTSNVMPLVIAEAMLTFGQTSGDDDSSQKFLPFVIEVKVGESDFISLSEPDKEESATGVAVPANANPNPSTTALNPFVSPPPSPSIPNPPASSVPGSGGGNSATTQPTEVKLGLQVDYWKEKDPTKFSLKTNFKSFHVSRLPQWGERQPLPGLALDVVTRGKKNIMRLPGKKGKEKDTDSKSQAVGNINRLICTSKHQHNLLQVKIDGVEWKDVKFFQLSSHWSSHVKAFPVAVFLSI